MQGRNSSDSLVHEKLRHSTSANAAAVTWMIDRVVENTAEDARRRRDETLGR